jgi:hypothetical protein
MRSANSSIFNAQRPKENSALMKEKDAVTITLELVTALLMTLFPISAIIGIVMVILIAISLMLMQEKCSRLLVVILDLRLDALILILLKLLDTVLSHLFA